MAGRIALARKAEPAPAVLAHEPIPTELAIPRLPIPVLTIDQAPDEPLTVAGVPVLAAGKMAEAAAMIEATHPRSWRNKNPGNLRTLGGTDKWRGQVAVDTAKGGPFAIFDTRVSGWRALTVCLLTYREKHGLRSVRAILTRYAPDMENDTASYVAAVSKALGVQPTEAIDVRDPFVMRELLLAIARHEGGRACPTWPEAELVGGMVAAGLRGP